MTMETTMKPMSDFLNGLDISMTATRASKNPNMPDSGDMDHWRCVMVHAGSTMRVYFSKGYGHNGEKPTLAEVLDCLASDAAGFENAKRFEDWCAEYGYDTDNRKAERIYKTVCSQASELEALLGNSRYAALLWETERD